MSEDRRKGILTPTAMRCAFESALAATKRRTPLTGKVFRSLRSRAGFVWSPGWSVKRHSKAA